MGGHPFVQILCSYFRLQFLPSLPSCYKSIRQEKGTISRRSQIRNNHYITFLPPSLPSFPSFVRLLLFFMHSWWPEEMNSLSGMTEILVLLEFCALQIQVCRKKFLSGRARENLHCRKTNAVLLTVPVLQSDTLLTITNDLFTKRKKEMCNRQHCLSTAYFLFRLGT